MILVYLGLMLVAAIAAFLTGYTLSGLLAIGALFALGWMHHAYLERQRIPAARPRGTAYGVSNVANFLVLFGCIVTAESAIKSSVFVLTFWAIVTAASVAGLMIFFMRLPQGDVHPRRDSEDFLPQDRYRGL